MISVAPIAGDPTAGVGLSASIAAPVGAGTSSLGWNHAADDSAGVPQGARDLAQAFADAFTREGPAGVPAWVWIVGALLAGYALARR